MSALIEFEEVCKYYQMGDTTVKAADHITMKIDKGEFVAIVGQSGSGKSTCMNIIGCLDVPTAGTYRLNGRDVGKMSRNELASIRNEMLGFIFQQYNLLPKLNLLENVEVPLVYAGIPRAERHRRAHEVLEQITLDKDTKHMKQKLAVDFADLVYNGKWFTPLREALTAFALETQKHVTGTVKLKLYKGNIIPASVTSPYSLYSEDMATFNEDDCYDQADSAGFINLFGLPLKVRALNDQILYKKTGEHFPSVEK